MRKSLLVLILSLAFLPWLQGQSLVSVSGLVIDSIQSAPIPHVNIYARHTGHGTSSSINGFFTLVAKENDTIVFSGVGYKKRKIQVPANLGRNSWTIVVDMPRDTIMLDETVVHPWPSPRTFKQAFLELEVEEAEVPTGYFPPGIIRKLDTTYPVEPNPILNPASFFYDKVVKEIIKRSPKPKRAKTLPKFD